MRFLGILAFGLLVAPGIAEPQENNPGAQEPEVEVGFTESPDGIQIHYQVRGEPNGNPALVLIHGWSHDLRFWDPHSTTLASTHQVIAVDLAGFGKSGKERTEWTMAAFGGDVSAVVEAVAAEQVVLLGFSMGAPVALEAALQMPDRVVGVIIIDALKDPAREMTEEQIHTGIQRMREEYGSREWVRRVGFTPATPSSYIDRCMDMITPVPPERWWASLAESRRWTGPRALEVLGRIEVPVAAIVTDRAPVNTDVYGQYLSSFAVRTMPGVGHLGVLWQDTEAFDRHARELLRSWFGS
jgi:pimeloyl-ACP methyl ester carboxylesterase